MIEDIVTAVDLLKSLSEKVSSLSKVSQSNDIDLIQEEARKQEIELRTSQAQAKVAQELAIAQRIRTAEQVEIEEYYADAAEGNAGLTAKEGAVSLGVSGSGQKVTKRVYRFTGGAVIEAVEKVIENDT